MNPNCRFIDGGRHYECPICLCSNEGMELLHVKYIIYALSLFYVVPSEYFSHLDHTGRRADVAQRPELLYGTVEYIATKDYCKVSASQYIPVHLSISFRKASCHLLLLIYL